VNDPGARNITFEQLRAAYYEQTEALIEGGADVILVETIFDTLNAKAALFASTRRLKRRRAPAHHHQRHRDRRFGPHPLGPDRDRLLAQRAPRPPAGRGPELRAGRRADAPLHPGAGQGRAGHLHQLLPQRGLPNPMSDTGFDETPEVTSRLVHEFAAEGLVNIVGGCCGTTPDHIAAIAAGVAQDPPRLRPFYREPQPA
jgi:5-methyltetrahydrofolate--homocysteine methyltransferase